MKLQGLDLLSSTRRRWALGLFLVASVLSSLGHSAGGNPYALAGQVLGEVINPRDNSCLDNSGRIAVTNDAQVGIAGAPLAQSLRVSVTCVAKSDGASVFAPDAAIEWEVTSGGGKVNGLELLRVAQFNGRSSANWRLGPAIGTQTLTLRSLGQTHVFSATGRLPVAGGSCSANVDGTGTNLSQDWMVSGNETWPLVGSPYRLDALVVRGDSSLTVEPGVQICVNEVGVSEEGRLLARGSAAAPVRFNARAPGLDGVSFEFSAATAAVRPPSEMLHTQVQGLAYLRAFNHALRVEDSLFTRDGAFRGGLVCGYVHLRNDMAGIAPSSIRRTTFDGFGSNAANCGMAGVTLEELVAPVGGDSVFAARVVNSPGSAVYVPATTPGSKSWVFENCEVMRSVDSGLTLSAPVTRVSNCGFFDNGSVGVYNTAPGSFTVLARGNWWGDPAGPSGPAGDRISTGVDASLFLTAPPSLGY